MRFYDMDGTELHIGDYVMPTEGKLLRIISQGEVAEFDEEVMIGQQAEDISAFSILTAENLAFQFRKTKSGASDSSEAEEILNIIMGGGEA